MNPGESAGNQYLPLLPNQAAKGGCVTASPERTRSIDMKDNNEQDFRRFKGERPWNLNTLFLRTEKFSEAIEVHNTVNY